MAGREQGRKGDWRRSSVVLRGRARVGGATARRTRTANESTTTGADAARTTVVGEGAGAGVGAEAGVHPGAANESANETATDRAGARAGPAAVVRRMCALHGGVTMTEMQIAGGDEAWFEACCCISPV